MPRNRPRVSGSWRDTDKGECWTKTNASGATFVKVKREFIKVRQVVRNRRKKQPRYKK